MSNREARNEQIKLTASWCNNLATAIMTVGVLTPVATIVLGIKSEAGPNALWATIIASFVVGIILHVVGRLYVLNFEEERT